jgi:hypothetical protein
MVGFCDLVIDDKIVIKGFKVFRNKKDDKLFVSAPSTAGKTPGEDGKILYYDNVRFLDEKENEKDWHTPFQKEVYEAMLADFETALSGGAAKTKESMKPKTGENTGPARAPRSNHTLWGSKK